MAHLICKKIQTTKQGQRIYKQSEYWYIRYKDIDGKWKEKKAYKDKVASTQLMAKIEKKIELAKAGIIDRYEADRKRPLREHLLDFKKSLVNKANTKKHANLTTNRVRAIVESCKFIYIGDIKATAVQQYLADRRSEGLSTQSSNFYLQAIKQFCRWMVQDRRASESPLEHLRGLNVKVDRRHDRRAFELNELKRLLETTLKGPVHFGMTGYERYLLYRFAVETGLRANEIRTLTINSFDFETSTVAVRAGYSKHRREDVLPLRGETVTLLKEFLNNKLPNAKVFGGTYKRLTRCTSNMIKADLVDTEIRDDKGNRIREAVPYIDAAGRYADFHSLRHTTGTFLAAAGVHPKVAQSIMRHSKIDLTMSRYTHTLVGQEAEAIAKLPDLSPVTKEKEKALATGTDNQPIATTQKTVTKTCTKSAKIAYFNRQPLSEIGKVKNQKTHSALECNNHSTKNLSTSRHNVSIQDSPKQQQAAGGFEPPNNGFANRRLRPLGHAANLKSPLRFYT